MRWTRRQNPPRSPRRVHGPAERSNTALEPGFPSPRRSSSITSTSNWRLIRSLLDLIRLKFPTIGMRLVLSKHSLTLNADSTTVEGLWRGIGLMRGNASGIGGLLRSREITIRLSSSGAHVDPTHYWSAVERKRGRTQIVSMVACRCCARHERSPLTCSTP